MRTTYFNVEHHGFYGAYFPCPTAENEHPVSRAIILMLGDDIDDRMAKSGAKWLNGLGCNVLTMAPAKKDYGHHNYPLERFEYAISFLQEAGNTAIGIAGASTTGMLALVAASYLPEITLTVALSPSDFVMEGFYRDGLDGATERPGDGESTVSWRGKPLPYLPYAYRHPQYWQELKREAKEGHDLAAARKMFDESESLHPLREEELIKVERIRGTLVLVGARDDVLWDTCRYIERMETRLAERPHECECVALIYEHGTHFVFPQSLLETMLPIGGNFFVNRAFAAARAFPKECRATREDIDEKLRAIITEWPV